jgi:hypothetical protein
MVGISAALSLDTCWFRMPIRCARTRPQDVRFRPGELRRKGHKNGRGRYLPLRVVPYAIAAGVPAPRGASVEPPGQAASDRRRSTGRVGIKRIAPPLPHVTARLRSAAGCRIQKR